MASITLKLSQRLPHCQAQSQTVDIPDSLKQSLRKFRFARRNAGSAALVIKINKATLCMEEVEQFDEIGIDELAEGMELHVLADSTDHE